MSFKITHVYIKYLLLNLKGSKAILMMNNLHQQLLKRKAITEF